MTASACLSRAGHFLLRWAIRWRKLSRRIAPFLKAAPPFSCNPGLQFDRKIRKGIFLVTGQRLDIPLERWLDGFEIRQCKNLVKLPHLPDGVGFQFLEADLVEATLRNQPT